jgi:murein DD-endopeptidase MepM/ murein hydrolase activator NlpD
MPAKGKHRRPKSQRLTRTLAAAGTGGAALALPLLGAGGAQAATGQSAVAETVRSADVATAKSEAAAKAVKAAKTAKAEKKAAGKSAGKTSAATATRTYEVRPGDWLAKIAEEQHVRGGWQRLYADNREAVGADPSLIHPGLRLVLGKPAATTTGGASTTPSGSGASRSGGSERGGDAASRSSARAEAPASSSSRSSGSSSGSSSSAASSGAGTRSTGTASSGFVAPVSGAGVGTSYRTAGSMWSSGYHTGVDFVVPTGTSLKAVGAGTVVSAGWGGAYGNQVVIRLADGYYAQYAHLSSVSVSAGQTVAAGQQVGLSGATGNVTGPHLHFEIRTGAGYGSDVDPVAYLRSKGVAVG